MHNIRKKMFFFLLIFKTVSIDKWNHTTVQFVRDNDGDDGGDDDDGLLDFLDWNVAVPLVVPAIRNLHSVLAHVPPLIEFF